MGISFLGRSIPVYDLKQRSPAFKKNPVLLQPADRLEWETVTDEELQEVRREVFEGAYSTRSILTSPSASRSTWILSKTRGKRRRPLAERTEEAREGITFP